MRFWRRDDRKTSFTVDGERFHLNPGSSLTSAKLGITVWVSADGTLDICPQMSEAQIDARARRDISAKYGVTVK